MDSLYRNGIIDCIPYDIMCVNQNTCNSALNPMMQPAADTFIRNGENTQVCTNNRTVKNPVLSKGLASLGILLATLLLIFKRK